MTSSDLDLDAIEARTNAATPGPWERYAEYGPTFFANITGEYLRGVGDFNFGVGDQAEADEEFVKHAREDVPALVAEVRRLRAELGIGDPWTCPVCGKENHRAVCLICETDRPDPEPAVVPAAGETGE